MIRKRKIIFALNTQNISVEQSYFFFTFSYILRFLVVFACDEDISEKSVSDLFHSNNLKNSGKNGQLRNTFIFNLNRVAFKQTKGNKQFLPEYDLD